MPQRDPFPVDDGMHFPIPVNADGDGPVPMRWAARLVCSCGRDVADCPLINLG